MDTEKISDQIILLVERLTKSESPVEIERIESKIKILKQLLT